MKNLLTKIFALSLGTTFATMVTANAVAQSPMYQKINAVNSSFQITISNASSTETSTSSSISASLTNPYSWVEISNGESSNLSTTKTSHSDFYLRVERQDTQEIYHCFLADLIDSNSTGINIQVQDNMGNFIIYQNNNGVMSDESFDIISSRNDANNETGPYCQILGKN